MSNCTRRSLSKMGKRTRAQQDRFNEQRRANKSKARQALFIAEYFQTKYFELYNEAATFFNALNKMYPTKYDVRKAPEFRQWKSCINGEIRKSRKRTTYLNIEVDETMPQTPDESESLPPQTPQTPAESSPPQSPAESSPPQTPQSPVESSPPQPPAESSPPQTPQTPAESSPPQSPAESSPPQSPVEYSDTMELRIPLLNYRVPQKSLPTVITETIEITQETEEPLTLDDIPAEKIEEIINQLRQDPDLRNIFTDIEQQLEFEHLGMDIDIDIPEQNLLEDELLW